MRKIHVTQQLFENSGSHDDLIEKIKYSHSEIRSMGVCVPNFRSVSFFVWPEDVTHIHKYTNI